MMTRILMPFAAGLLLAAGEAPQDLGKENPNPGIYKLEGDTLTMCRATATGDVEPPHEFKTTAEEGLLTVWKRATK